MRQKHPMALVKQDNTPNFSDFSRASFLDWKNAAILGLKGAPYEKCLNRTTLDGIPLRAVYTPEDLAKRSAPAEALVRNSLAEPGWRIGQIYQCAGPEQYCSQISSALAKGVTEIRLVLDAGRTMDVDISNCADALDVGVQINRLEDLETAFPKEALQLPLRMQCYSGGIAALALLAAYCRKKNIPLGSISGSLGFSLLSQLMLAGKIPCTSAIGFDEAAVLIEWMGVNTPKMSGVQIDGSVYQQGGAGAAVELACCVSEAATYFSELMARGITADEVARHLSFQLAMGGDFFEDIAKQRALRLLFGGLAKSFGATLCAPLSICTRTSGLFATKDEPLTNVLRSITATLSGALGGAKSIHAAPFDEAFDQSGEFSQRVARNSQVVLQQECQIGEVADPCGGSYYMEHLTDKLAATAWEKFQQFDAAGGFVAAASEGLIQQAVDDGYQKQQAALYNRKQKMVGVNDFVAPDDAEDAFKGGEKLSADAASVAAPIEASMNDRILQQFALDNGVEVVETAITSLLHGATFSAIHRAVKDCGETSVVPLPQRRLASSYEQLRRRLKQLNDQMDAPCSVCLLRIGTVGEYKARTEFSRGFFQAVGFSMVESPACATVAEAVTAAQSVNAHVTVICSTDEKYAEKAPELAAEIKRLFATQLVLAGRPGKLEKEYVESGIDYFIYLGANHFALLERCIDGICRGIGNNLSCTEKQDETP